MGDNSDLGHPGGYHPCYRRKDRTQKKETLPSQCKEHWTARASPQNNATAVTVPQDPTDHSEVQATSPKVSFTPQCLDHSGAQATSPKVSFTPQCPDHSLVGATKHLKPLSNLMCARGSGTSTTISQPSLQRDGAQPSHSPLPLKPSCRPCLCLGLHVSTWGAVIGWPRNKQGETGCRFQC